MEPQPLQRTNGDDDPARTGEAPNAKETDAEFGTRMQSAESEAERFGDPDAVGTTPPDEPPLDTSAPDRASGHTASEDALAEDAERSYVESQPEPPAKEPLVDPLGGTGHAYS